MISSSDTNHCGLLLELLSYEPSDGFTFQAFSINEQNQAQLSILFRGLEFTDSVWSFVFDFVF